MRRFRRFAPYLGAFIIYASLSLFYFGSSGSWTKNYAGHGADPYTYMWFFNWWPFAIRHHLNPFVTDYIWYPGGLNLAWTTSIPLLALALAPFTAILGPILLFNVLTMLAPVLSALTAFGFARYLIGKTWPSLVAGYLFGFSSYELGHLLGHLNFDISFFVPLAVWLCVARFRGDLRRLSFILLFSAVLIGQFGVSVEVLATLCLFGGLAWLIFWSFAPSSDRIKFWMLARDVVAAAPIVIAAVSPILLYMIKGMVDGQSALKVPDDYSLDLLNIFFPTCVNLMARDPMCQFQGGFAGNAAEQGAYLGLPLVLVIFDYFRRNFSLPYVKAFLILICTVLILSLGSVLRIGVFTTSMPLPWSILAHAPIFRDMLPIRFSLYIPLFASIICAFWLSEIHINRQWLGKVSLLLIAMVTLLPNRTAFTWSPWPASAFFQPKHIQQVLGYNRVVLIFPFFSRGPAMAWQLDAQMTFKQAAGYLGAIPEKEYGSFYIDGFLNGDSSRYFEASLEEFCIKHQVDYILLSPEAPPSIGSVISRLAWPSHIDNGIVVVKVPASLLLHAHS
jgi:hypothetical protein